MLFFGGLLLLGRLRFFGGLLLLGGLRFFGGLLLLGGLLFFGGLLLGLLIFDSLFLALLDDSLALFGGLFFLRLRLDISFALFDAYLVLFGGLLFLRLRLDIFLALLDDCLVLFGRLLFLRLRLGDILFYGDALFFRPVIFRGNDRFFGLFTLHRNGFPFFFFFDFGLFFLCRLLFPGRRRIFTSFSADFSLRFGNRRVRLGGRYILDRHILHRGRLVHRRHILHGQAVFHVSGIDRLGDVRHGRRVVHGGRGLRHGSVFSGGGDVHNRRGHAVQQRDDPDIVCQDQRKLHPIEILPGPDPVIVTGLLDADQVVFRFFIVHDAHIDDVREIDFKRQRTNDPAEHGLLAQREAERSFFAFVRRQARGHVLYFQRVIHIAEGKLQVLIRKHRIDDGIAQDIQIRGAQLDLRAFLVAGVRVDVLMPAADQRVPVIAIRGVEVFFRVTAHGDAFERIRIPSQRVHGEQQHHHTQHGEASFQNPPLFGTPYDAVQRIVIHNFTFSLPISVGPRPFVIRSVWMHLDVQMQSIYILC